MPIICPSILADSTDKYREQMSKIAKFASRVQIDLTDGIFAPSKTVSVADAWWPAGIQADFHIMYQSPEAAVHEILEHRPNLVIVHAEAEGDFENLANYIHDKGVKVGVALLPSTSPQAIVPALKHIDHALIFSGDLGSYGGHANLSLLSKAHFLKSKKPDLEIGWDGGVNSQNVSQLVFGGIDVLDVGGYIQNAHDPEMAYNTLGRIAEETGTT